MPKIAEIIAQKPLGNHVLTTFQGDNVWTMSKYMDQNGVRCLVVTKEDSATIAGMFTATDVFRGFVRFKGDLPKTQVNQVMTGGANVLTCSPDDDAAAVRDRMAKAKIGHMPVVQDGKLCGLVNLAEVTLAADGR